MMILCVLSLLGLALAEQTPANFVNSKAVCDYLDSIGTVYNDTNYKVCNRIALNIESKYTDCKQSFFTNVELERFIVSTKVDVDELEHQSQIEYDAICKADNNLSGDDKKVLDSFCKIFDSAEKMSIDADRDICKSSSKFVLGSVSLATCPENYYDTTKDLPIVKNSIVKELTDDCSSTLDMMDSYMEKIIKMYCDLTEEDYQTTLDEYKEGAKELRDEKTCESMVKTLKLESRDKVAVSMESAYTYQADFADAIFRNLCAKYPEPLAAACGSQSLVEKMKLRTSGIEHGTIVEDDDSKEPGMVVDDSKGFDMLKAAQATPDYNEMVNGTTDSGFPWWLAVIIETAVIIVGFAVYFIIRCLVCK